MIVVYHNQHGEWSPTTTTTTTVVVVTMLKRNAPSQTQRRRPGSLALQSPPSSWSTYSATKASLVSTKRTKTAAHSRRAHDSAPAQDGQHQQGTSPVGKGPSHGVVERPVASMERALDASPPRATEAPVSDFKTLLQPQPRRRQQRPQQQKQQQKQQQQQQQQQQPLQQHQRQQQRYDEAEFSGVSDERSRWRIPSNRSAKAVPLEPRSTDEHSWRPVTAAQIPGATTSSTVIATPVRRIRSKTLRNMRDKEPARAANGSEADVPPSCSSSCDTDTISSVGKCNDTEEVKNQASPPLETPDDSSAIRHKAAACDISAAPTVPTATAKGASDSKAQKPSAGGPSTSSKSASTATTVVVKPHTKGEAESATTAVDNNCCSTRSKRRPGAVSRGETNSRKDFSGWVSTSTGSATTTPPVDQATAATRPPSKQEVKLPACPYPGHDNISWTCLACGGATHHLTSRLAMEPLRKVHGFKVHRVPNDGDCFFSSIKAAVDIENEGCSKSGKVGGRGGGLTVAEMRNWVAEEMGEEQLEFYTLQAKANPEERWLDFVRPLDKRVPSDDEDENEGDDDDGDDSVSQQTSPEKPRKSRTKRNPAVKTRAGRDGDAEVGTRGGAGVDGKAMGLSLPASGSAAAPVSDREARRLRRLCKRTMGVGMAAAAAAEAARPSTGEDSAGRKTKVSPTASRCENTPGGGSRRSSRLGSKATLNYKEGSEEQAEEDVSGSEQQVDGGEEGSDEGERGEEEENEGLPVVHSVEELRRFVRRQGADVGHGRCLWADTHAHHVISRRLRLTILFVDMEREKTAWPYRVLARTVDDYDDDREERFVVLKREPNHFVLLEMVHPVSSDEKSDGAPSLSKLSKALFFKSELPDVVRRLWKMEQVGAGA